MARVQHEDIVRHITDHAQVVGNEHIRRSGFSLMLFKEIEHLRLNGYVQR